MGLFGSSDSGDTGFASKLRTSTGSKDLDLSYGNDSLGGQGFNDSAGDMNAQEFANTLQMQGQMAQLFSKVSHDTTLCMYNIFMNEGLRSILSKRGKISGYFSFTMYNSNAVVVRRQTAFTEVEQLLEYEDGSFYEKIPFVTLVQAFF